MTKDFFIRNRKNIFEKTKVDTLVFAGNVLLQRSNDAAYAFAQEANFWYLTGIDAPGWWLVVKKEKSYLIAPNVDEVHRIFDGSLSNEEATTISGVDGILDYTAGNELLEATKASHETVATICADPHEDHYDFELNPGPVDMRLKLEGVFGEVQDCRLELAKMRAIKSPEEIQIIRRAIQVTIDGFEAVRGRIEDYSHEYEIEADFTHAFVSSGASGHAYDPIVAAGKNACTLHYGKNRAKLSAGELILLDIGASVEGYAADITRTYAYGNITDRQRAVHAAVEQAHLMIIDLLRPGLAVTEYAASVDGIMQQALASLGLLGIESDYRKYFPHSVSHGLGIDVHDSLGAPSEFQVGMVLTVEPGIYIPEEGIGVRIEDDILITEEGNENLSAALPTSL